MRSLIIGASGQIGANLVRACTTRGYAHLGTWYRQPHHEYAPLDIRDEQGVDDLIADYQPDITLLAAGIQSSGYAEQFPEESRSINVDAVRSLAGSIARHGGTLALFSPDTVFGDCSTARREDDPVGTSLGQYESGKLEAEAIVRELLPERHLIIRTGWVYSPGERRRGFLGSICRRLEAGETVEVAMDRFGQPTYGPDLATAALDLLAAGQTGLFHLVGPDKHSEATWARLACHVFGYDVDLLHEVRAAELGEGDPRPNRVWLDRFKARTTLGPKFIRSTADGVRALRDTQTVLHADIPLVRAA